MSGQACWTLALYPEAAEGGGCFRAQVRREPVGGGAPDPERSQEEAARRARAKLRRYCAANRLNRLGTLTYAGEGSKNVGDERIPKRHRYEVGQGFQPRVVRLAARSDEAVIAKASARMGGAPALVWRSSEQDGWRGPPAYWCAWAA